MKYIVFMCRTVKILISNWPRMRKFSQVLQAEKTVACDSSHHGHALVTLYVQFVCSDWSKIGQVSSCGKFMQHLESCLLVMVLTVFFYWMYEIKFSCYQESCYSGLVCLLGFWLRNTSLVEVGNPILDGIHSFSFFTLLDWKVWSDSGLAW